MFFKYCLYTVSENMIIMEFNYRIPKTVHYKKGGPSSIPCKHRECDRHGAQFAVSSEELARRVVTFLSATWAAHAAAIVQADHRGHGEHAAEHAVVQPHEVVRQVGVQGHGQADIRHAYHWPNR